MKRSMKFVRPTRLLVGGVAALGMMVAVAHPPRVFAGPGDHVIAVPEVPRNLEVQSGNTVYLEGHAVGTQNYICMACPNAITPAARCPASGFAWAFLGPQATLFDAHDERQVITHYNSPNPGEGGRERPTWQHSRDTSAVWGNNTVPPAESSTDPAFVRQDAIPWLLLPVASTEPGPKGPGTLTETTFIQRLDTEGGLAPDASTCAAPSDAGKKALVPYSADYFFYKKAH